MELQRLRYFVALAHELNFTRAAERAHVTQQAMSRAIAQLERELGVALVLRRQRGCSLTPDGHLFLSEAVEVLRRAETMKTALSRRNRSPAGHLDVILFHQGSKVDQVLAAHRLRHPDVRLRLHRLKGAVDLLAPLLAGRADAVIGPGRLCGDADVDTLVVDVVPRVAVVPLASAWGAAEELTSGDLLEATFGPRHPLEPRNWEGDWNLVPERGEQPRRADFVLHDHVDHQAAQVTAAGCVFTHAESYGREAAMSAPSAMTAVPMPLARPVDITVTTLNRPRLEAAELRESFGARGSG